MYSIPLIPKKIPLV